MTPIRAFLAATPVVMALTAVGTSGPVARAWWQAPGSVSPSRPAASASDSFAENMQQGESALARRQFLTALDAFTRANVLRDKKSPEAWLGMSRASYGHQVFLEALKSADQALKYAARGSKVEAAVRHQRALALMAFIATADDDRAREAANDFAAAARLDARWTAPSFERGVALLNTYRDVEGVRELKRLVSEDGDPAKREAARRFIADPREARVKFTAADFSLAVDGKTFSRASLANQVVLLDFWGSWCGPCLANTPALVALHKKYASQIVTIGVAYSEDRPDKWQAWIAKNHMDWPQYRDDTGEGDGPVAKAFRVEGVPTYIVIDREGRVRARLDGWEDEGPVALEAAIKRAIAVPVAAKGQRSER